MAPIVRRRASLALLVLLLLGGSVVGEGCGSGSDAGSGDGGALSAEAAQMALKELPYRYEFKSVEVPAGATEAFVAHVHGPHHTTFSIGVALGQGAKPVPMNGAGTWNAVGDGGFVFNNDILIPAGGKVVANADLQSRARWRTANEMATAMEEKLCRVETGKPCTV